MIGQFQPLTRPIDLVMLLGLEANSCLIQMYIYSCTVKEWWTNHWFKKMISELPFVAFESYSLDSVDSGDSISLSEASVDQSTPVIVRKFFPETLLWILEEDLGLVVFEPVISPS